MLENNLLFNTCRESSDHGPFNSWDRQPFLTDVADPKAPSLIPLYNEIHHNFFVANYGANGGCVDNDDGEGRVVKKIYQKKEKEGGKQGYKGKKVPLIESLDVPFDL